MKKIIAKLVCMFIPNKDIRKSVRHSIMNATLIPFKSSSENPKLIMTILAKDEADIIEHNLKFHKAMGVDGFIVTDNVSTDGTLEIFEKYKQKGWILEIINETSQKHDQDIWVSRMVNIARDKYNAEWVINCDADEFWFSKKHDLKFEISKSKFNILKCPIYNMVPPADDVFFNSQKKSH